MAVFYFFGYAIRKPLTQKLYKELFYSAILGLTTAAPTVYYFRRIYLDEVDVQYHRLKGRFRDFPELNVPDSRDVNKNFGMKFMEELDPTE